MKKDKKKATEAMARYRKKNPEKVLAYNRSYRAKNRERLNESTRRRYAEDASKTRAYAKRWNETNWKSRMISWSKQRAKKLGLECKLTQADIPQIPALCPVALIPIYRNKSGTGPSNNSPSLDRIDNTKGYLPGNVRIISYKANRWKADMSMKDVERLLGYMRGEL